MAGFFGLFNYEKEGPGIEKNAPKKKTFALFFETFFRNFWKLITINIIYWLLAWLPFGFAAAGITNVTRNLSRDKHSFGISDFFETIKKNFVKCLTVGFLNILVIALSVFDIWFFYNSSGGIATVGLAVSFLIFIIFFMMRFYIWFLVITFDLSFKQIYVNSFKFVIVNLKNNFIIAVSLAAYWAVCIVMAIYIPAGYGFVIAGFLTLFVYPGFRYLLVQYGVFGSIKKCMIDPYYEEHPDDDIEKRRDLGLDVGDNNYSEEDLL